MKKCNYQKVILKITKIEFSINIWKKKNLEKDVSEKYINDVTNEKDVGDKINEIKKDEKDESEVTKRKRKKGKPIS